jgi:hypothetical protein
MTTKTKTSWISIGTYSNLACDGTRLYAVYPNSATQVAVKPIRLSDGIAESARYFTTTTYASTSNVFYNEVDNSIYMRSAGSSYGGYTRLDLTTGLAEQPTTGLFAEGFLFRKDGCYKMSNYDPIKVWYNSEYSTYRFGIFTIDTSKQYNLLARKRLDAPIIKTSSKTMKVTYDFIFS